MLLVAYDKMYNCQKEIHVGLIVNIIFPNY